MSSLDWHRFPLRVSVGGRDLVIRPVTSDDRARIIEGLRSLSAETTYRRFFTPSFYPSDEQLQYLTEVDGERHMALGAVDASAEGEPGVGVARYIRLSDSSAVAETAVLVVDAYQQRGVGSILLAALSHYACTQDVETFRGYVLQENRDFLRYLRALGAEEQFIGDGTVQVELPVMCTADDLPETPATRRARWAWRTVAAVWDA